MQRPPAAARTALSAALAAASFAAAGCSSGTAPTPAGPDPNKPFAGRAVSVGCADPAVAAFLKNQAAGWAARAGATATAAPPEAADVVVVRPAEFGALAANGGLLPVPGELRAGEHPLQRGRILESYRDVLTGWGGAALGLPVAGDGFALVTRADVLKDPKVVAAYRAKFGRDPAPPSTYEDVEEVAAVVGQATNAPALPALPTDDAGLVAHFDQIAACYDRPAALARTDPSAADGAALSFHYSAATGASRLKTPGFHRAAEHFARTQALRQPPGRDPVAALDAGAACAVLALADVGRLPRGPDGAVAARFTVSRLPGTRTFAAAAGAEQPARGQGNYVPCVGANGWVGAVRASAPHPAAAWDYLAQLAGPAGSTAALADTTLGAGPFRREHFEPDREKVWSAYRLSAAETPNLVLAARSNAAPSVVNPAVVLRTPDRAARVRALADAVRKAAAGTLTPPAALAEADAAWLALDAAAPPADVARWKRNAAGVP